MTTSNRRNTSLNGWCHRDKQTDRWSVGRRQSHHAWLPAALTRARVCATDALLGNRRTRWCNSCCINSYTMSTRHFRFIRDSETDAGSAAAALDGGVSSMRQSLTQQLAINALRPYGQQTVWRAAGRAKCDQPPSPALSADCDAW